MVAGKSQIAAAAVVVAVAGSALASPTYNNLVTRGNGASRAAGKAVTHIGMDLAHGAATDRVTDAINDHIHSQQQHHHDPKLSAALAKATGPHNPALVEAALKAHKSGGKKKRDLEAELYEIFARGNGASRAAGKVVTHIGKDMVHTAVTDQATDAINNHINSQQQHHHDPKLSAALAKAAGPHDPALVEAAVKAHKLGKKKRDLEDELYEIFARGNGASRAAGKVVTHIGKDMAHTAATDRVTDAINDHINGQQQHHHLDPKLSAALAKATGPHNPALVEAAVKAHKLGKKKRDLEDELYEIFARGNGASRAAGKVVTHIGKDMAHTAATDRVTDAINDHINSQQQHHHLDPKLSAALAKATGPHNPALVEAAVKAHKLGGKKKRDLEDEIFARAARAAGVAAELAKNLAHDAVTTHLTGAINNHIGHQQYPQLPSALAKATGPHNPALVSAVVQGHQHGRRDLEDELYELFARAFDFELDDLE